MSEHALDLPGGPFRVWRTIIVRGAGFPARVAEAFAGTSAGVIDAYLDAPSPTAREAAAAAFAADEAALRGAASILAADPKFREAVLWQNHALLGTALDPIVRGDVPRNNDGRRRERYRLRLLGRYVQRYALKNDTIGFFGPVGFARAIDEGAAITVEHGANDLARREVYFETWAIEELGKVIEEIPGVRPWIAPRLLPIFDLEGTMLRIPARPPVTLPESQAFVLRLCDGTRPAREIASLAVNQGHFGSTDEVLAAMQAAKSMGVIAFGLDVASEIHPERRMRSTLSAIGDGEVRAKALAPLEELASARDETARAAGDAPRLAAALEALDETFARITGAKPSRAEGAIYAARTLVREECLRDTKITIGPSIFGRIGPALTLLLRSARFFSWDVARRYRRRLCELHASIAREVGTETLDFLGFQLAVLESPTLGGKNAMPEPVAAAQAELVRRWGEVLAIAPDARDVRLRSADLEARVKRSFSAPGAGWPSARYASPDVLIAARDVASIERGDARFVLGELHLANTVIISPFAAMHPNPQVLGDALAADHPDPYLVPIAPRALAGPRPQLLFLRDEDFGYEFAAEPSPEVRGRRLRGGTLLIEPSEGSLVVRTRDGAHRFDVIDFIGTFLSVQCGNAFRLLDRSPHTPRVTIDDLVVARETWRFPAEKVAFARVEDRLERMVGARRFARAHALPRRCFAWAPPEKKPLFIDFESVLFTDILASLVGNSYREDRSTMVTLSEMLPEVDELWLTDAKGAPVASELRMTAFDAAPCARAQERPEPEPPVEMA